VTETLAQPLPLRLLIDEAARHSRRHFRALFPPVGIPLALAGGLMPLAQRPYFEVVGQTTAGHPDPVQALASVGLMLAASILFVLAYGVGYSVMLAGAVDAVAGREIRMAQAWRTVLSPRFLGTLALCWIVFLFGFACCVLPGLYVGLLWSFVVPVMVEEGRRGGGAIGRSGELTSYNPQRDWGADPRVKVFLVGFVAYLAAYLVSIVVQLPLLSVQWIYMWREMAAGRRPDPAALLLKLTWLQVPSQMLGMLVQTAVHLYVCVGIALLYFDVRRRKEGDDLEAALAALETPAAGPEPGAP
jgi:hypothetical protein